MHVLSFHFAYVGTGGRVAAVMKGLIQYLHHCHSSAVPWQIVQFFLNYKTVLLAFIASFLADFYFLRLLMCFTICGSLKPGALRNADCCFMILDVFHFYRRVASAKHGTFVTSEHIAASVIIHFEVWKLLYLLAWSRSLILCHIAPTCLLDDSSDEVMYIQMFCTALHAIAPLLLTKVMFVDYLDSVL